MIGKTLILLLFIMSSAYAGIETEIAQQQAIEKQLIIEVDAQKARADQAYKDAVELASASPINRHEQLERLEAAYKIWADFIDKICQAEVLDSIGTRAEPTSKLTCMVKRYKEQEHFFESSI